MGVVLVPSHAKAMPNHGYLIFSNLQLKFRNGVRF
jgi:hypothetical protein